MARDSHIRTPVQCKNCGAYQYNSRCMKCRLAEALRQDEAMSVDYDPMVALPLEEQ